MFERYLSDALTTYFGSFVENLDSKKVRLSAWKGELVLTDLVIRKETLDLLLGKDCPLEISYGKIANLELKIPWKKVLLWSSSSSDTTAISSNVECCVILSDLHVLVTPKSKRKRRGDAGDDDHEVSLEEERLEREQAVQRLLDAQLFQRVAKSSTTEQSSSRWQWARELVKNLLSNLSVTVQNIHLRYEDAGRGFIGRSHHVRESFAVGITLRQFSVQTKEVEEKDPNAMQRQSQEQEADSTENDKKSNEQEQLPYSIRHKLAVANELALYWDRGRGCHLMTANVYNEDDIYQLDTLHSQESMLEDRTYFENAFYVLNGEECDNDFRHRHLYGVQHTYLLSPVSPSMEFALVSGTNNANSDESEHSPQTERDEAETHSRDSSSSSLVVPPSTMDMTCPPCCLTISANTLEDTAYLRKSLAIWSRTRKSSISEASVRLLTGLRPLSSPVEDPRSWWQYAVEATIVLERRGSSQRKHWRPPGWGGLARAIKKRREYVNLYEKVLHAKDKSAREEAHRELLELEDVLIVEEIVAFRLSVYSIISGPSGPLETAVPETISGQTWSEWMRGKKEVPAGVEPVGDDSFVESEHVSLDDVRVLYLTLDHRRKMYLEMKEMIEQEQANQLVDTSFRLAEGSTLSTGLVHGDVISNVALWKTSMAFKELSVQINERVSSRSSGYQLRPVVRLSCALAQHQTLFRDDSWEVVSAVASLQVVDLTGSGSSASGQPFPVLLGGKSMSTADGEIDDTVVEIDGTSYPLSASVSVRRSIEHDTLNPENVMDRETTRRSTTHTTVRLMPLEVVYSTNPVAALTRALSTVKTPELTDDYHRMESIMAQWRSKQRSRLLQALAHKRKKIVVDVDIAAPVVLIPEDPNEDDSPLLAVDLGRLRFSNTDECIEDAAEFDDKWQLALDDIQVHCSSTLSYRTEPGESSMVPLRAHKLVEPFSLHFLISTKIASEASPAISSRETIVNIHATLPRLVFNLKSSAVRLVERLKLQWAQRANVAQTQMAASSTQKPVGTHMPGGLSTSGNSLQQVGSGSIGRRVKFRFSAPLIGFRLENDVDGRGCESDLADTEDARNRSCPLVDLALRGISGEFVQTVASDKDSTSTFDACLKSVTALDLYQKAGEDFAFLLSSLPPSEFSGLSTSVLDESAHEATFEPKSSDLVVVQYISSVVTKGIRPAEEVEVHQEDTLAITFHELYAEWNPETIAAIHKGMLLPKTDSEIMSNEVVAYSVSDTTLDMASGTEQDGDSDDEFYDAIEATDTSLRGVEGDSDLHLISGPRVGLNLGETVPSPFLYSGKATSLLGGGIAPLASSLASPRQVRAHADLSADHVGMTTTTSFQVKFSLSTLRVNFNKDSRNRRVLTAEMDDTDVLYFRENSGRSRTKARIGNLSFVDPSCKTNSTLYKEILGLKADFLGNEDATSLLEMELMINPERARRVVTSGEDLCGDDTYLGVSIGCSNGTVRGEDISVSLQLSPMRFVYLQQLWLEIIDYFFEAIVGYEVWGKESPPFDPELSSAQLGDRQQEAMRSRLRSSVLRSTLPGLLAEEFSFTRFDVRMDKPMILLPVSYQSPHFLRLDFGNLTASNSYLGTAASASSSSTKDAEVSGDRAQWFNNCDVHLNGLRLTSWDGPSIGGSSAKLDSKSSTDAQIKVNWPVGKWASTVVPKWKVDCDINPVILSLHRESYALLQHIIFHNIGELSRHLEEWNALQNLPPSELESYKKEIMVHFGYDKKDTAPSTYAISVKVPSIKFLFLGSPSSSGDVVMEANCTLVEWQMKKLPDRISRQQVTCDISLTKPGRHDRSGAVSAVDLLQPVADSVSSYSPTNKPDLDSVDDATSRELSYTSTTRPDGDNVRVLKIVNACIFGNYPAWLNVKQFFSNLPEPDFMNHDEIGLAMQIGDRWYRIGGSATSKSSARRGPEKGGMMYERGKTVPSYQFRLLLKSPRVVLSSESADTDSACVVLRMDHFEVFHHNNGHSRKITKTFFVHDLGLYTSSVAELNQGGYVDENSLIRPWCIAGQYERCDPRLPGPCEEHAMNVTADVLQARAAYSDMSVALDVCLRLLEDLQHEPQSRAPTNDATHVVEGAETDISKQAVDKREGKACETPRKRMVSMELDGFELQVVDDSMRHFAAAQQLIKFSLHGISFYQVSLNQDVNFVSEQRRTKLSLRRIDVFDCLQPELSPFTLVATSRRPTSESAMSETSFVADSDDETSVFQLPRMSWLDLCTIEDSRWGFKVSPVLSECVRSQGLLDFCDADVFPFEDHEQGVAPDVVELHHLFIVGVSDEYIVNVRPLTLQWNPSTVIALQRFLGRLYKEARLKSESGWAIMSPSDSTGFQTLTDSDAVPTRARFRVDRVTVLLNKEHQHRCLVRATLSDSRVLFEHNARNGMVVEGSIKDLSAWDTDTSAAKGSGMILEENRRILRVVTPQQCEEGDVASETEFLQLRFKTFAGRSPIGAATLPAWVRSRLMDLESSSDIDDFLSVSMATVRVCYLRERAEEILDYLSNGLPGKGMGATSRAAKGFINKRIKTKSFLELNIMAPQVYVPQHEKTYRGVVVRLGDVTVRSWFEEEADVSQSVWYRVLSLSLDGLRWSANERNTYLDVDSDSVYAVPLDVKLTLRKPTKKGKAIVIKGSLSLIELTLTYTAFVLLKAVMKDNISREIDVTRWDNVEKAYWMEEEEKEGDHVSYSSNARFIRYGQERRRKIATTETDPGSAAEHTGKSRDAILPVPKLDCSFSLDGMRLKLHRNDHIEGLDSLSSKGTSIESAFCHDIVVLRASSIEVSFTTNSIGDKSLQVTLDRLGVFDLGERGRLARVRYYETFLESSSNIMEASHQRKSTRNPSAFSVLLEGYSPSCDHHADAYGRKDSTETESQLLLTVDTCSSTSTGLSTEESISSRRGDEGDKIVLARMVFNYLSVNALVRPLREIVAFLTCSWPHTNFEKGNSTDEIDQDIDGTVNRSVDQVEDRAKPVSLRKGLQLKVVAHYPRVFFLADESDPCSRALVLRGLAVLDASIVEQETTVDSDESGSGSQGLACGFSDKKVVTAVNAQLQSMETYINPNVENALGMEGHNADLFDQSLVPGDSHNEGLKIGDELLGVALIEPVTAGIECCQIRRDRFPTLESFSVNMEPVSTMLSFEDLTLLEAILERWSPRTIKATSISGGGSSSHLELTRMSMGMVSQSSLESLEVSSDPRTITFDVTFETERLGLILKKVFGKVVVERVQGAENVSVQAGDILTAINGGAVGAPSLDEVVEVLATTARPVTISFSRSVSTYPTVCATSSSSFGMSRSYSQSQDESVAGDSVDAVANETFSEDDRLPDVYSVTLRRGVLNGLTVEPSPCGGLPAVIDVLPSFFLSSVSVVDGENGALEVKNNLEVRLPRTGAVVAEIDGKPSSDIGYLETKELFDSLSSKRTDADKLRLSFDSEATFCVKFLELDSSEWGKIKTADVVIAGVALTFIDDFKGRDMPLLRGKLDAIEVHVERGLGVDPRAVVAPPPDVLDLAENGVNSNDSITVIRTVLQAEVDYYHPRTAIWEPLLEPSDLSFMIEWQQGSSQRPGQLALEASDSLVETGETSGPASALSVAPRAISFNLTDAAAEVVVRTIKEWRDWRQRSIDRQETDSLALGMPMSQGDEESIASQLLFPMPSIAQSEISLTSSAMVPVRPDEASSIPEAKRLAAQKAAKAALLFAQKRGAGTKKKSESSTPFVFRNRTGMSLYFEQQAPTTDDDNGQANFTPSTDGPHGRPLSPRGVARTLLADGADARFHMDIINQEKQVTDEVNSAKRVRAYDGQYPSLCVVLEASADIVVEPLANLPVFKVGNTIRRLQVRKATNDAMLTNVPNRQHVARTDYTEFSVPVVWTVEIEDNRRVLTLSSAVRVISSGVRLSVDVGVCTAFGDDGDARVTTGADTIIEEVGNAQSGSPFYLPLWLALKCEKVEVFVKPSGLEYSWSEQSILSFTPLPSSESNSLSSGVLTDWEWKETFCSCRTVSCERSAKVASGSDRLWLSCVSLPHVGDKLGKDRNRTRRARSSRRQHGALISIAVDAGLTIRNLLPVNLQWEVGAFEGSDAVPLDGSAVRAQRDTATRLSAQGEFGLLSGEGVDVLSFTTSLAGTRARFRCYSSQPWSEWCLLSQPPDTNAPRPMIAQDVAESEWRQDLLEAHLTRQVNVQLQDEFGVPITIGVRIVPKVDGGLDSRFSECFGYDAIVFAELWLRNLTPLPVSFGCPSTQITPGTDKDQYRFDETGIINAEAALLEIASILELGDRGKGFNLRNDSGSTSVPDNYLLPYQSADLIFDEVFEYVEVENSVTKRRWWASETHDSLRQDPQMCKEDDDHGWQWIDDEWKIDCSGQSLRSSDGWESCRSLIGGKEDFFLRRRMFNPSHPFRRRRWFRRRRARNGNAVGAEERFPGQLYDGLNAFHQPVNDAFSRAQEHAREMQKKKERNAGSGLGGTGDSHAHDLEEQFTKISIRCGGGQWSAPCVVPKTGGAHGIIRVPASRWPTLTKLSDQQASELTPTAGLSESSGRFARASLSPALYELCYKVADLGDDWGELTRMFLLTPRFMMRNDSRALAIEVKQSGAPDDSAVAVKPGDVVPFFWADFRLPELVSLRPVINNRAGSRKYRWSGGFDVCTLGMTAIRLRRSRLSEAPRKSEKFNLKSIRTLVEIRTGTGGTGINLSFKEEDPAGSGSLFRIENLSPFHIWVAQDGVLANPSAALEERRSRMNKGARGTENTDSSAEHDRRFFDDHARTDGDLIEPGGRTAFALDVPFRQGKYAGRKAASMSELTRIRAGLAPLSSRDGVESTKVVSLSTVGESVRLSPAKLSSIGGFDIRTHLVDLRVLGIVTTDGPTRVLRFCMMRKNDASGVFDYTLSNIATSSGPFRRAGSVKISSRGKEEYLQQVALDSAMRAIEMDPPKEDEAMRLAFFGNARGDSNHYQDSSRTDKLDQANDDTIFSFRASFNAFSCSLIDKVPSEIALVTLKDIDVSANWNKKRTADATSLISVGWLQVDNFVPSAPFPVAVCPVDTKDEQMEYVDENDEGYVLEDSGKPPPLLLVGLTFAPKHESGILCLRSATIAPRDMAVSVDLAFVVRLQQFLVGIGRHFRSAFAKNNMTDRAKSSLLLLQSETREFIPFPDIESMVQQLEGANAVGVGSQKLYFQGLSILPCNVNLSVAPARALTSTQASLEGSEAAALHAAVRKGDLLVGGGMLGVNIGHKNQTAVAVVRGVFKSIIVDALLRCEAASLNFAGVYLRNHISTGPQLKTFLGAHYMESLKSNVPALLGSMAALGNPLGLIRGIGDGMSDFVNEPVKGLRKSMEELDPSHVVGGVARGTKSLARHTVGGFAGSASLLTETFSKNMAVITLDRRYAQRRDRRNTLRSPDRDFAVTFFEGVESGAVKLVRGVWDGVSGVVRAPIRGAERHGMEGFAKGVGKGLLGLLVKPLVGLSDAATDVMIGVQGSVEGKSSLLRGSRHSQVRPRRPMYGRDRVLRSYSVADAAAATLMLRTQLAGENYLSHCDMDDKVALLSVKRALVLGSNGQQLLLVKYKNIENVTVQAMTQRDDGAEEEWAVVIVMSLPGIKERPVHVIKCATRAVAVELCSQLNRGVSLVNES